MQPDLQWKNHRRTDRFIKAFHLFKILINNIGSLISPMPLTEEVMRTQFYDKVGNYETLEYTNQSYKQEEYTEKTRTCIKCSLILKLSHQKKTYAVS